MSSKVAVLPANGLGDALLMMIASHQLLLSGYQVVTFHNGFDQLATWFANQRFAQPPPSPLLIETLSTFDIIIFQNDNSLLLHQLHSAFGGKNPVKLSIFYPSYLPSKHPALLPFDQVFLPHLSMAENISASISSFLSHPPSKNNGIIPPAHLIHRYHKKRIVIAPTSRMPEKNWIAERFFSLAKKLQYKGYTPIFSVSPEERKEWLWVEKQGICLPNLTKLSDLAELIYESGYLIGNDSFAGHLASNLYIPTLIIANDPKRMRLWRPDWLRGKLVFPPGLIPNIKGLRWREKKWRHFISVRSVLNAFYKNEDQIEANKSSSVIR